MGYFNKKTTFSHGTTIKYAKEFIDYIEKYSLIKKIALGKIIYTGKGNGSKKIKPQQDKYSIKIQITEPGCTQFIYVYGPNLDATNRLINKFKEE